MKKKNKEQREEKPCTVEQLIAAMIALGQYAGKNSEAEHRAEAERLGGMNVYRMFASFRPVGFCGNRRHAR